MRSLNLLPALLVATSSAVAAADVGLSATERLGLALVENSCGTCHAAEAGDVSPVPEAPPFVEIAKRYPPEDLSETLAEGIVTGHQDMPEFVFEPDAIGAIIAYLDRLRAG